MQLECKPDFEETCQRWSAFWSNGRSDRPMIAITVPKPGYPPAERPHPYLQLERVPAEFAGMVARWAESCLFLGDQVPSYNVSFCPDHFALLLGADMHLSGEVAPGGARTGWIEPFLHDYDQEIRFCPESRWWEKTVACIEALKKECDGRILVNGTHIQGGLDALSAIRGNQQLLIDLATVPDDVKNALTRINAAVDAVRRAQGELTGVAEWGSVSRHGLYAPGYTDVPQCDFSCMISREMFQEFEIPCLESECAMLDGCDYHLDGPDAIRHLKAICSVEKITTVQWQPGAGWAAEKDWSELYRQIDNLGRGQLRCGTKAEVLSMIRNYRSNGKSFFGVTDITSIDEADDFLNEVKSVASHERV